jgi:hypothetical protein
VKKNRWKVADIGIDRRARDIPLKRQQTTESWFSSLLIAINVVKMKMNSEIFHTIA